jgi:hypothetical protein
VAGENEASIENCYSGATVSGSTSDTVEFSIGGVTGTNSGGILSGCYFTGTVTSQGSVYCYAGGVAGSQDAGSISNCYSTGAISVLNSSGFLVGGIMGAGGVSTISNCYATGAIHTTTSTSSGISSVGGIAGGVSILSTISKCAALNPSITCSGSDSLFFGRVVGNFNTDAALSNNIAFNKMLNPNGATTWDNIGLTQKDGADYSAEQINADGTLGGRFTSPVWTTANGKLPGLLGNTVDIPPHLWVLGIASTTLSNQVTVYPNPTTGELRIIPLQFIEGVDGAAGRGSELRIDNVEIFDVYGRNVGANLCVRQNNTETVLDLSNLTNGIYFIRIQTEQGVVTKKVVKN